MANYQPFDFHLMQASVPADEFEWLLDTSRPSVFNFGRFIDGVRFAALFKAPDGSLFA